MARVCVSPVCYGHANWVLNMTTATEQPTDTTTGQPGGEELEQRTSTESLLTDQDGDEAVDSTEVEEAMLAGFSRATGRQPETGSDNDDAGPSNIKQGNGEGDGTEATQGRQPDAAEGAQDDPEVPGLGMKASEVKARLGKLDTLEKTLATANGHIGHLKQQIQNAGKGKAITAESLKKVTEEFGAEYAQALAEDLTAAGIGGGSTVDEETLGRIVGERVATIREELSQSTERKLVRQRHPDAADYFAEGKSHAQFMSFVGALPKDRQDELASTWDSEIINRALDEFKAHKQKVESEQTKQNRRLERGAAPTASRGAAVTAPTVDPIEAGWNSVRGRGRGNQMGARR